MTQITGAELLARAIANEGGKFVFGLAAFESDAFLAALEGIGMEFITVRHEGVPVVAIMPSPRMSPQSSVSANAV